MPVIRSSDAPVYNVTKPGVDPKIPTPHLTVRGHAAPKRGAKEIAAWHATFAPGLPARPGTLTREWFFLVLSGVAKVTLEDEEIMLNAGDSMIVPANTPVALANGHDEEPLELIEVCPVGVQLAFPGMPAFTPEWAE